MAAMVVVGCDSNCRHSRGGGGKRGAGGGGGGGNVGSTYWLPGELHQPTHSVHALHPQDDEQKVKALAAELVERFQNKAARGD